MAALIKADMVIQRFPDARYIFKEGAERGFTRAQKSFTSNVINKWPVKTGLSKAGWHFHKRYPKKGKAQLLARNEVSYAGLIRKGQVLIREELTRLNKTNWGNNYRKTIFEWRKRPIKGEKELRNWLLSEGKVVVR